MDEGQDDSSTSTEYKLAVLASLNPNVESEILLDLLIAANGSVDEVNEKLNEPSHIASPPKAQRTSIGYQSSLSAFRKRSLPESPTVSKRKNLTKKGQTLHLYAAEDIATHTPCSIVHNFLPAEEADDLLRELLEEAPTFESATFKLFDNVVHSPHTASFYVESLEEEKRQKTEYLYNGSYLSVFKSSFNSAIKLTLQGCPSNHPPYAQSLAQS